MSGFISEADIVPIIEALKENKTLKSLILKVRNLCTALQSFFE